MVADTVLFSHNKSTTSNQPAVLFSQNKPAPAISHQPNEQAVMHLDYSLRPVIIDVGAIDTCPRIIVVY
jgi:hypothetical protein